MESIWLRVCCAGKCRIRIFDLDTKECEVDAGQWCNDHCWNVLVARSPGHQLQTTFHPEYLADCWILLQIFSDTLRYAVYTRHCNHFYQITLNQQHQQHISADYTTSCQDSAALHSSNTYLQYQHETLSVQKLCKIFRTRKKC